MHLLTEDLLHMAACLSCFEVVPSDIGPQLTDPFVNQNDLDYRIDLGDCPLGGSPKNWGVDKLLLGRY